MKHKILLWIFLSAIVTGHAQELKNIEDILSASREVITSIKSVEYKIVQQKAQKHRYGQPYINAVFSCVRDNSVKDIGFGKAKLKAEGTIKLNGKTEAFSFSYNGSIFKYTRGTVNKVIKSPNRRIVMGYLQQHLFMLQAFPYTDEVPYKPLSTYYKYLGKEDFNGTSCYKIKTEGQRINKQGNLRTVRRKVWYINTNNLLPIGFTDELFYKQAITIKSINNSIGENFEVISKSSKSLSVIEANIDLEKSNLLKLNTIAPKWIAKDQNGKKWSTESLKGKVVFIDFWGSWCAPCKKAMPQIEKLYQHYKNNPNVVVLGLSSAEKNKDSSTKYFKEKKYNYIHVPNADEIANMFKVKSYPTIYIIDKQGKVSYYETDFSENALNTWRQIIDNLLN